jgi:hypothetical protein
MMISAVLQGDPVAVVLIVTVPRVQWSGVFS